MIKNKMLLYKRNLKASATKEELLVLSILKENNIEFFFQKCIGTPERFYIVDFYIKRPYKVCIEIDGNQHLTNRVDYDVQRTSFIESRGKKVVRFRNDEVKDTPEFRKILINSIYRNKYHWLHGTILGNSLCPDEKVYKQVIIRMKSNPSYKLRLTKNQCEAILENFEEIRKFVYSNV